MERAITTVIILVNHRDASRELGAEVEKHLRRRKVQTVMIDASAEEAPEVASGADLLVSLGGDGTLLYGARCVAHTGIPILGVNLGEFGFITEISREEWRESLDAALAGEVEISERMMVSAELRRPGTEGVSCLGLNDVVLSSARGARVIRLRVSVASNRLGRYRADGVIVATPTGSTAYSMSAGGPILHPEMNCFVVNPICPFTLSNRPIVVPGSSQIEIAVEEEQRSEVDLTVDGRKICRLSPLDVVMVKRAEKKVRIVRSPRRGFYEVLRSKLRWSGEPHA